MLHVKEFRAERGLMAKQMVEVLREQYPKYDKALHSKVERPEEYGIRLVNEAERLLEDAFQKTTPASRKPDRRRLPVRIQCRLSKTNYTQLQLALKRAGFDTVQAGLTYIINLYLDKRVDAFGGRDLRK